MNFVFLIHKWWARKYSISWQHLFKHKKTQYYSRFYYQTSFRLKKKFLSHLSSSRNFPSFSFLCPVLNYQKQTSKFSWKSNRPVIRPLLSSKFVDLSLYIKTESNKNSFFHSNNYNILKLVFDSCMISHKMYYWERAFIYIYVWKVVNPLT